MYHILHKIDWSPKLKKNNKAITILQGNMVKFFFNLGVGEDILTVIQNSEEILKSLINTPLHANSSIKSQSTTYTVGECLQKESILWVYFLIALIMKLCESSCFMVSFCLLGPLDLPPLLTSTTQLLKHFLLSLCQMDIKLLQQTLHSLLLLYMCLSL